MEFGILGPLAVWEDGRELKLGAAKQRALLAILLLHAGETMATERLVDALWGEKPPATAVKALQVHVSQLRKVLGGGVIETRPTGYELRVDEDALDLRRFEGLLTEGRRRLAEGASQAAADVLREALALWRGPALADVRYESFARDEIGRLDELRLVALGLRIDADLGLGLAAEVVPELEALVREHPLRERLRELLILALYRAGRQADALAAYQDARVTLVDELGLDPGEGLQRLEKAILLHDPSLELAGASVEGLPTGTVTFLFTDVEGSTELLARLGRDEYATRLDEHRRLLRAAFAETGGREVDTQGDAFFIAFPSAAGAIQAATRAQRETAATQLSIRIGIHTGEPAVGPTGYVGLDVPRAARICSAGHGGQVLISQTTRELVEGELPDGIELRDLGEHRLKGLTRPQRLSQLVIEGLLNEFPALRTLYHSNLPVPATAFLGRERELSELTELLRDGARLVTLTGPGGSGKTRLALQAAAAVTEQFPDGVWWVPLASLRDSALVLVEVARKLDIDQPGREPSELLTEVLARKRLLLLLDNAEHLLPDAANALALLRESGGPTLLVTSRERLQLAGEHVYAVPPLTQPDGLALFSARASAVSPSFEAGPTVEELCARLDSLPLAIELAAARTLLLTPEQILERLSQRLDLFTGSRDADPRQQTLRSTIEWSHDLLAPEEQRLFARLAVFAGGCTLEAAEEVCDADLDTLAALVDKSVLRRSGVRYWMLETIREFALEQLDRYAEADALRSRHADFFELFAAGADQSMRGRSVWLWLGRVEEELPNLRSALQFSVEHGEPAALRVSTDLTRFWAARDGAEGLNWLERALATDAGTAAERAKASLRAGPLAYFRGDVEKALTRLRDAIELAHAAGDDGTRAEALAFLGMVLAEQGDFRAAEQAMRECRQLASTLDDLEARADALRPLASVATMTGNFALADDLNREALAVARELGDEWGIASVLTTAGYAAILRGAYADARNALEESLEITRRMNDTNRLPVLLGNLGLVAVLEGRYEDALSLLEECLQLSSSRDYRRQGSEALLGLAAAHAALGNAELAVKLEMMSKALADSVALVFPATLLDRLEPHLCAAREQIDPAIGAVLEPERGIFTLDTAITELERYGRHASTVAERASR